MAGRDSRSFGVWDYLRAVYELPLGLASFTLFKLLRKLVCRIGQVAYRNKPELFQHWNILSGDVLEKRHQLSRYMVTAPRWNPHAAVATAGPIEVEREVTINLDDTVDKVGYWYFGALHFPTFASTGYVSSLTGRNKNGGLTLLLPRGNYYIVCRYYGWPETVHYPAISADGKEVIAPVEVSGKMNDFYPNLPALGNAAYRASQYHTYVMLKYRSLFSERFVHKHLLPVGNEDTRYIYGTAERGEALSVTVDPALFRDQSLFCCCYNIASLPIMYTEINEPEYVTKPLPCKAIYLIRIMQKRLASDPVDTGSGAISVTTAEPAAGAAAVS